MLNQHSLRLNQLYKQTKTWVRHGARTENKHQTFQPVYSFLKFYMMILNSIFY